MPSDLEKAHELVSGMLTKHVEIKSVDMVGQTIQVTLDFAKLNTFIQKLVEQAGNLSRRRYGIGLAIEPVDGNYITEFPQQVAAPTVKVRSVDGFPR